MSVSSRNSPPGESFNVLSIRVSASIPAAAVRAATESRTGARARFMESSLLTPLRTAGAEVPRNRCRLVQGLGQGRVGLPLCLGDGAVRELAAVGIDPFGQMGVVGDGLLQALVGQLQGVAQRRV